MVKTDLNPRFQQKVQFRGRRPLAEYSRLITDPALGRAQGRPSQAWPIQGLARPGPAKPIFGILCSLDRHCRMKRIDMAIKLDHELRLTRRRSWDMQNFEADLFMMVSRPSEANFRGRIPKYYHRKIFGSNKKNDRVETGFPRVEGVKPEAREARRGPRRAK